MKHLPDLQILEQYQLGANQRELAQRYGVAPQTIGRRLIALGVTLRHEKPLPLDEVVVAYRAGATQEELGERYGVAPQTIARRLKDREEKVRSYTGPRRGRPKQYDVDLDEIRALAGTHSTAEMSVLLG